MIGPTEQQRECLEQAAGENHVGVWVVGWCRRPWGPVSHRGLKMFVSELLSVVARPLLSLPVVEEEPHCKNTQRNVLFSNCYVHVSKYNRICKKMYLKTSQSVLNTEKCHCDIYYIIIIHK